MTETSKFKVPARKPVDPTMLERFAAGAEQGSDAVLPTPIAAVAAPFTATALPNTKHTELNDKPWIGLDDKKRMPAFSLRLTAAEQAKLKYLSNHTPDSMHEICLKATRARIEQLLKELGNSQTI